MIFIVDDDLAVLDSLRLLLETEGLAVQGFASAAAFLAAPAPTQGDCLMLDLEMPRMGGLELLAQLRKRGLQVPIVLVMSRPNAAARRRARALGVRTFLQKPFHGDDVVQAVRAAARGEPPVD